MRRSVQVGIAVLVLSVRLWSKLFIVSDVFGKMGIAHLLTQENLIIAAAVLIIGNYIAEKVLAQMIFRARMAQKGIPLMPQWFPFLGNVICLAKAAIREEQRGTGRNVFCVCAEEFIKNKNGIYPRYYAINSLLTGRGMIVLTDAEAVNQMILKSAKSIDKIPSIKRLLNNFGGDSFVFMGDSQK